MTNHNERQYLKGELTPVLLSFKEDSTFSPAIQVRHGGTSTKWLNITPSQLLKLIELLGVADSWGPDGQPSPEAERRGQKIVDLLGISPSHKATPHAEGTYSTADGDKTLTGLARTLKRYLIEED